MSVELAKMTRELFHELYRSFEYDPVMFADEAEYEKYRHYEYNADKVDAHFDRRSVEENRVSFAVLLDGRVIGEAVLKHIDLDSKQCELGIHLINGSVKNRGYGTEAERLALHYAFDVLGIEAVLADCLVNNLRSRHVIEKLGFEFLYEKDGFGFYRLDRQSFTE